MTCCNAVDPNDFESEWIYLVVAASPWIVRTKRKSYVFFFFIVRSLHVGRKSINTSIIYVASVSFFFQ